MKCIPLHIHKHIFRRILLCHVMGVPMCNYVLQLPADDTKIVPGELAEFVS